VGPTSSGTGRGVAGKGSAAPAPHGGTLSVAAFLPQSMLLG
jgi:hypothetical protein